MPDLPIHHFEGRDGATLAYREVGEGRPVLLIHGFVSTGVVNWVRFGHAEHLAGCGFRVVMPDLRGHGASDTSHDPAAYPADALVDDGLALVAHLGLDDYDLGGYSLGGRTVARMLVRGATPRRAVIAGMGLDAIVDPGPSNERFRQVLSNLGSFERGSSGWMTESFLRSVGGDPVALLRVLDTAVPTAVEELAVIGTPTLVLVGADDVDHASARRLADVLPDSRVALVPGNHMGAVTKPDLASAIASFLGADTA